MSTNNKRRNRGGYYPASADPITICVEHYYELDGEGTEVGEGTSILRATVPIVVRHHRDGPGGQSLCTGEVSAGSLDLALNILGHLYPPACEGAEPVRCRVNFVSNTAFELHELFCTEVLAPMDRDGGEIPVARIRHWVERLSPSTER